MVIPIEILARELDGKLLLASCAKERGWNVIVGGMAAVKKAVPHLPPFVYFAKSARSTNAKLFGRLKQLGHEVVVLDEESLVRHDNIFLMKHERDALKNVDLLLTWGEDSREMWLRSGMADDLRTEAVGNPRIDMLTPQLRAYHQENIDSIQSRYGDFVLFNSNFAMVNHKVTGGVRFNLALWTAGGKAEKDSVEYLTHKRTIFERFCLLIPKLAAAIAPRSLVIRPHPSEDHAPWNEAVAGCANAHVIFEGSVVPWIAAARVLIHNGCTSAVEAAIEGTPVLTYRPLISDRFDNPLPNSMGLECRTDEHLLVTVEKALGGSRYPLSAEQMTLLHRHIEFAENALSSDGILDALERSAIGFAAKPKLAFHKWLKIYVQHQRQLLPRRLRSLSHGHRRDAYKKHKFSGLTEDTVNARIEQLRKLLSRFYGINAHEIGEDLVELR